MLDRIIDFSIHNKLVIGLLVAGLIGLGIYELQRLPIDAVPDITDNQVQIITTAPSLGAPDVERLITFPIEQVNSNIPGLKGMRSISRFGLSVVTIVFTDATDIYWARQQVSERLMLAQEQIPKELGLPVLAPVTTGLGEIYQYALRAKQGYEDQYDAMQLRTIQDWIVRRQLLGVKGVAEVSSFGGLLKQYEIAIEPEKLLAHQLSIKDIFEVVSRNNQNTGGAYIEKGESALFIRSEGLVTDLEDIRNIVIKKTSGGIPLLIRDVAKVQLGHATRFGAMTYNGDAQVSGAVVMMLKGANSNEVIRNIKRRITQIQKTLPEGVIIDPFLDRTKMVNNSINTVSKNLFEGALIVIFVLVLFLGNLRAGLLVASVIPLAMMFAIIMMNLFGVSGNLMSLGALDFGLIVDGAVIIVEAVMHRLTHSKHFANVQQINRREMDLEVAQSSKKMMNSAVFGQVIILVVYLPIFTLEGIEGKMFKPMAQTVAFALIGAFILSLSYIPMMSSWILSRKLSHHPTLSDRMMFRMERYYQHALEKLLEYPKAILGIVLLLLFISGWILSRLGGEFIPSLPEGDFAIDTRVLPGSNLNTSIDAVSRASKILLAGFPEIEKIVAKTGASEVPTDPMALDASDIMVILKDRSRWTSAKTYEELEEKMSEALKVIPGVSFGFQYPVAMRFNELMSGSRQDVVCKIFGDNMDTLSRYAGLLGELCNSVVGSSGLFVESVTGMPQIVIRYRREAIAQYGVDIADINRVINTSFAGVSTGKVYEGDRRFDLVVRLDSSRRNNLNNVSQLLIPSSAGFQLPLYMLADVQIQEGVNQIQRENSQRRIIVGFNVRGRDIQSMVTELQSKVEKALHLPPGYFVTYGGAFENLEAAKSRLALAVPVSLVLIFILLYFAFQSVKLGLLIYSAIPLSAIGGILALASRGIPFSISAGVGFIALFGVAVLNGIVLIAEFKRLSAEGYQDLRRIVIQGTKIRLRPVLMTAFVASLGFLPMALSHGEGAEVQRPLATVVIGGLLVATFLTLFVLPILYVMFNQKLFTLKLTTSALLILPLFFSLSEIPIQAQTLLSPQDAVAVALANNLNIKNGKLKIEYQQKLLYATGTLSPTAIHAQLGQYNSIFRDQQFSIHQSFSFPSVYRSQKNVQKAIVSEYRIQEQIDEARLTREVLETYWEWIHLSARKKLLQQTVDLYATAMNRSQERFNKGETNTLEPGIARALHSQIEMQQYQLETDIADLSLRLQYLLNTEQQYIPDSNQVLPKDFKGPETNPSNHPRIQLRAQEKEVYSAETKRAMTKRLPDLLFGYGNTSIQGTGADNRSYQASHRFHFVQAGLEVPLQQHSKKAIVEAGKINEMIASNNYNLEFSRFNLEYATAYKQYENSLKTIASFEKDALPEAEKIKRTANEQLSAGEIDLLQWSILIRHATEIWTAYEDARFMLSKAIIILQDLTLQTK